MIRRLKYYTPLRYPGGKGKLAAYIKAVIKTNNLFDGDYIEPYCGGAAVALELLFHQYVTRIHINDLSKSVWAFWDSVLNHTDTLCGLIRDTPLTVKSWDRQKQIFANEGKAEVAELGFATFFLNRTNRSGILNGGIIGGRDQTGKWKIDARFNRDELIFRVESIAKMRDRIHLTRMDALKFLAASASEWPDKALIYLDPPYFQKGHDLYYNFYEPADHRYIHRFLTTDFARKRWIISYDNAPEIRELYKTRPRIVYRIGYSAREARTGAEVMFFSDSIQKSPIVGSLKPLRGSHERRQ